MKNVKVVAAVIIDKDKVFATQRGYGDYKHWWEFPGGKIEENETSEEALKREIFEELEISIHIEKEIGTIEYDYPTFHLSMQCFFCTIKNGSPKLKEHENAKWLTQKQLKAVKWLPADLLILDKVKERLSNETKNKLEAPLEMALSLLNKL